MTNDKTVNQKLLHPQYEHERTYWVQVEGDIQNKDLLKLQNGVTITIDGKPYRTKPARLEMLPKDVVVPDRNPPIRFRQSDEKRAAG